MYTPFSSNDRSITATLVALDKAMRKPYASMSAMVDSRMAFVLFAMATRAMDRLNDLADRYAPTSMLSERSLDRVFEDGQVSEEVCRQLVAKASMDAEFRARLVEEMGDSFIARHTGQDLFLQDAA